MAWRQRARCDLAVQPLLAHAAALAEAQTRARGASITATAAAQAVLDANELL